MIVVQSRPEFKLVKELSDQTAIVTVCFERNIDDDEMETLRHNHKTGTIKADPDKDLELAIAQQLTLELQESCDSGMDGTFQVVDVETGLGFDTKAMGWKPEVADMETTFTDAINGLREYHPILSNNGVVDAIRSMITLTDTGNQQNDYEHIRDQIEQLLTSTR
jgi:hypothetical protein